MPRSIYPASAGWQVLAGQDVTNRRGQVTRYMLLYNPILTTGDRSAIVTAQQSNRTDWQPYAQGRSFEMAALFDNIGGGALD
jgi:hypothetical protein